MDFRNYKEKYRAALKSANMKENTIKTYCGCMQMYFQHFKKEAEPKAVSAEQIKFYLSGLSSPAYQRQMYGALKNFYIYVINQPKKLQYVPFAKREEKVPIVLSQQEIERIILATNNLKHKLIIILLYSFGIRRQELIDMQFSWIDRQNMFLKVKGKGNKERLIPIQERILNIMEQYYKQYRPNQYMIEGAKGAKYSPTSISKIIKRAAAKAGVRKEVTAHTFRHSYATHLLDHGISLREIQVLLGHSSSKTTERYTTVSSVHLNQLYSPIQSINL
ncbi:tyrosine-type recombinase/integrase [Marivirga sp.]|uniref:tyrosine-type recombinase/integrase n=1 Tax=Marivirga sp. TaxID=2018662 RepID=UPI003DA717AC